MVEFQNQVFVNSCFKLHFIFLNFVEVNLLDFFQNGWKNSFCMSIKDSAIWGEGVSNVQAVKERGYFKCWCPYHGFFEIYGVSTRTRGGLSQCGLDGRGSILCGRPMDGPLRSNYLPCQNFVMSVIWIFMSVPAGSQVLKLMVTNYCIIDRVGTIDW